MKFSIRAKLSLIFLGFLGLVSGSVYATSLALETQALNIAMIDLVTHQRSEVNNIARAVIGMQTETEQSIYYLDLLELDQAVSAIGETIEALLVGGSAQRNPGDEISIPAINSEEAREVVVEIEGRWEDIDRSTAILLTGPTVSEKSRAITEIEIAIPLIYANISELTEILHKSADSNLFLLRTIQITFFASALALLVWGYLLARNNIIQPISQLQEASRRIAAGDLSGAIELKQKDEVGELGQAFETMRQEVAAARATAETWAEELESRVEQRTNELGALLDVSADLSANLEVEGVLSTVVETAKELFAAEASVLCLLSKGTNSLSVASSAGPPSTLQRTQAAIHSNLLRDVINRGKTVSHGACSECPILADGLLDEAIVAPLQLEEEPFGAICVVDVEDKELSEDSARVLTFLADSAAVALENARLYDSSQSAAALAERERIAAEMHDGLAQTLGYLNLKADQALNSLDKQAAEATRAQLELMQPAIQNAYQTVRNALAGLRDDGLTAGGFRDQLKMSVSDFEEKSSVPAELALVDDTVEKLSPEGKIQLVRVAQEGLTNVRKHAEASQVKVSLAREGKMATLTIEDDGCGFEPAHPKDDGAAHLGLKIMRGRVERVGGSLTIQSQAGGGTRVIARVPLNGGRP